MPRRPRRRNNSRRADIEAQSEEDGQRGAHEMNTRTLAQAQRAGPSSNAGDSRQPGDPINPSDMPPMIGDFDDNANSFWSLHMKEAKSHDEARIQAIKDDMDSVLIFAGLFSAALVSFIIDKIQDLQVNPAQQMVYYQQQVVTLLAQISTQVSSIAPQVSIPSAPLPPYPNFNPTASDVRINAFWFMSLMFSLSAALLATLVQRCVRDYMQVFQRYSSPLKSARLRQYLYEGVEGWYMPLVAESVPSLVHVSLFLFFMGICDMLFSLNTTIGITTVVPIFFCGLLYVLSMFAPVINPKSPYQNPFSGMIWYLKQLAFPRHYSDRASGGVPKKLSWDMSTGKVQLAMEENEGRKERDVQAIQWLIDNSDNNEVELSAMAIPGTFTSKWGIEVWRKILKVDEDANSGTDVLLPHIFPRPRPRPRHILHPHSLLGHILVIILGTRATDDTIHQPATDYLRKCARHLLSTCNDRSKFPSMESWRMRARGCVETMASLVFYANFTLEQFGDPEDIERLLRELGDIERTREKLAAGSDLSFVTRWICLSLMVVPPNYDTISLSWPVHRAADWTISKLSRFQIEDDGDQHTDQKALENCRRIDSYFESAKQYYIYRLGEVFSGRTEEQVRDLARDGEAMFSELERVAGQISDIDREVSDVNDTVDRGLSEYLPLHLPGVSFDRFIETELIQPDQFFNLPVVEGQKFTPPFVFLGQRLRLLCSYAPILRDIIDGQGDGVPQEVLDSLQILRSGADSRRSVVGHQHLMERQLWRLLDLRDGAGFGLSVEFFFLFLAKLLSMAQSADTHSALYTGTFRSITSGWEQHKDSVGTQRVILNLVCDIAIYHRWIFSDVPTFPRDVTTELLVLLEKMTEGQRGPRIDAAIDDAMGQLRDPLIRYNDRWFADELISRLGARLPS